MLIRTERREVDDVRWVVFLKERFGRLGVPMDGEREHVMSDSDVRAEIGRMGSPQVTLTRLCENPGLAVTTSVARIGGFGLEDGPDSVADEPVATSNENDVWHRRC